MPPSYDEGHDFHEADADLYIEHAKNCGCSHCKPEDHGPMRDAYYHWHDVGRTGIPTKGWLFE